MPGLIERECAMMACLSEGERKQLDKLLSKLCAHAPDWSHEAHL